LLDGNHTVWSKKIRRTVIPEESNYITIYYKHALSGTSSNKR